MRTAAGIASSDHLNEKQTGTRPILWTSWSDRLAARKYFSENGLDPENTIAFHLTANSHDAYKDMLPRSDFLKVARHFIGRGFSVLMVSGSLFNSDPLRDRSYRTHLSFMEALGSPACRLFYGNCLAEAEIIRLCRALLSGETGVAHIASAVETPKLTIAATMFQTGLFLMTGPNDREFIVEGAEMFDQNIFPKASEVIEAMEGVLGI